MKFVNLTNYIPDNNVHINSNEIQAKEIAGKSVYKLENAKGLIWASPARNDEFYSDWETVQPNPAKYVVYYDIAENTQVVKPKDLFEIRQIIEYGLNNEIEIKNTIIDYAKQKFNNPKINKVICEVDNHMDVCDLHTLFNTPDVGKVVEGYAKSFSAMFWNYIDEKDESGFQIPSLMIMDSECMKQNEIIREIPYQRRKNGANKFTGENSMELNPSEFKKLIDSDLNIENAVKLIKIKNIMDNSNLSWLIDDRLRNFDLLEDAKKIVEQDEISNQVYIITKKEDRDKARNEILNNTELQRKLSNDRLNHNGQLDEYMAVYVGILEDKDRKKYLRPIEKNINKEFSIDER